MDGGQRWPHLCRDRSVIEAANGNFAGHRHPGLRSGPDRADSHVVIGRENGGWTLLQREQAADKVLADQALKQFEVDMGLVTPETVGVKDEAKELGAAKQTQKA